jgi:hypothetical protein
VSNATPATLHLRDWMIVKSDASKRCGLVGVALEDYRIIRDDFLFEKGDMVFLGSHASDVNYQGRRAIRGKDPIHLHGPALRESAIIDPIRFWGRLARVMNCEITELQIIRHDPDK